MDRETVEAIAEIFMNHGLTELWMMHDDEYPSEAVFLVNDAEYARAVDDATLLPEVAVLLPHTKLGLVPYTPRGRSRRLLPTGDGDPRAGGAR